MTINSRFDIVVFNYKRIESFLNNFNLIINFNREKDRITVITTSQSGYELKLIKDFEQKHQLKIRYLSRKNTGIDQLGRIQYFLGEIGNGIENTQYDYIFQMQEHYLDTTSAHSIWGKEFNYKIKGDVVPDNIVFDLDEIENLFVCKHLNTLFCDRNNPCFFSINGHNYIAPNGGNFILRTSLLKDQGVVAKIIYLKSTFEDAYGWAVFAEFFWGEIFFSEDSGSYDYKRKKHFETYKKEDFYLAPDNYLVLREVYTNRYLGLKRKVFNILRNAKKKLSAVIEL